MRHVLSLFDLTAEEIQQLFVDATFLKAAQPQDSDAAADGPSAGACFREAVAADPSQFPWPAKAAQLGAESIFLAGGEVGLGSRESVADAARSISQYADGVVLRTFSQQTIDEFAAHASCPVINGLSERATTPARALADVFTLAGIDRRLGRADHRHSSAMATTWPAASPSACARLGGKFIPLVCAQGISISTSPSSSNIRSEVTREQIPADPTIRAKRKRRRRLRGLHRGCLDQSMGAGSRERSAAKAASPRSRSIMRS